MNKSLVNSNFLWRVVFTFMIVLTHCSYIDRSNTSYYIGVDYFFIISGLMIVYGIDIKGNIKTTFEFTVERIKKLYPHVILSNTIFFVWVVKNDSFRTIIRCFVGYLYQFIPMMYFVMPDGGVREIRGYLNFPVWYISVLLIGGIIVHYMYSNHKSFFVNLFSSIFVLSGYYYLVKYCDSFNNGDPVGLFTNTYYIRGLTDMLCGGMLYRIILELKKHNFTSLSYALFRIIEVLSFIMLFYAVGRYGNCNNDIYFVLLICVIVIISFMYPDDKGDVFKKFKGVNDLMYPVYLNHIFVLHIVCSIPQFSIMVNWNKKIAIIVLFIAICIYSFFTMKLLKIIQFIIHKARGLFIEEGKTIL